MALKILITAGYFCCSFICLTIHALEKQSILEQQGLNSNGPLAHGLISINIDTTVNVICPPYNLNNIFFSLAYFIVRIWYIVHITTTHVNWLYITSRAFGQQQAISS